MSAPDDYLNKTFPGATPPAKSDPEVQIKEEEKNASLPPHVQMNPEKKAPVSKIKAEFEDVMPNNSQKQKTEPAPPAIPEGKPSTSTVANPGKTLPPSNLTAQEPAKTVKSELKTEQVLESPMDGVAANFEHPPKDKMKQPLSDVSSANPSGHIKQDDDYNIDISDVEDNAAMGILEKSVAAMSNAHANLANAQVESQRQNA